MGDAEWKRIIECIERLNEDVKQRRNKQVEDIDRGEVEHIAGLVREYMAHIRPQNGEAIMEAKMADQPGIMRQITLFNDSAGVAVRMHLFTDVNETYIHTHKSSFWSTWLCGGMYMHKLWTVANDDGRHWKHVRNEDGSAGQKMELEGSLTGAMEHTHRNGGMYFISCDTPHTVIGQEGEKVVTLCVRSSVSDQPAFIFSSNEVVHMGNQEERRSIEEEKEKAQVVEELRQLFVAGHEDPQRLLDQALQRWLALSDEERMIAEWPNLIDWFTLPALNNWRNQKIKHKPAIVHMLVDPRDGPPLLAVLGKVVRCDGEGLSLDAQRGDGCTCLHLAYFNENTELVHLLVGLGAKKEITNTRGETPLRAGAAKKPPRARFKWRCSVDDLLNSALPYLRDFNAIDFATAFNRLAKLTGPEMRAQLVNDNRFKKLVNAAFQRLEDFHTDAVSITAWSFAKLNYTTLKKDFIDKLSLVAMQCDYTNCFAAPNLCQLAWAYATLEIHDEKVSRRIAAESILKINEFTSQGLATIAWAFAKLSVNAHVPVVVPPPVWRAPGVHADAPDVHAHIPVVVPPPVRLAPGVLADAPGVHAHVVPAVPVAQLPHKLHLEELFSKIAVEASFKMKHFNPQELSMLVSAFAKLDIPHSRHKDLFHKIAAESILKIKLFDLQGLSMMARAFQKLNITHLALFKAIEVERQRQGLIVHSAAQVA